MKEKTKKSKNETRLLLTIEESEEAIKKTGNNLIKRGIQPCLDEWEIKPGQIWQDVIAEQIENIKSAAVFISPNGPRPWHDLKKKRSSANLPKENVQ